MAHMLAVIAGAVLAGVLVVLLRHARFERLLRFWAVALSVAAAIYVGFVLVGGAQAQWFWVEVAGFILFSVLAFLGYKFSPWMLAMAWFAHIAWDTLLHSQSTVFVPQWYPAVCVGFDLVMGAYLIVAYSRLRKRITPNNGFHGALTRRRP
jgi:hypothetical protein